MTAPKAKTLTPEQALQLAVSGDASGLESVARHWRARIRRWALFELGDAGLAEDAAQDTLVNLIRYIHQYDTDRPFAPWLRTIVRNCCRKLQGRQARHTHVELTESHLRVVPDPTHRIEASRAIDVLATLSPRQREVMYLCTRDGLSAAEAARKLDIAPSTARVLLFRARKIVREALGGTS